MPKRKRMSFTVKKQRVSLTPVKTSLVQKQQLELSGKRPRGRPSKTAKLSAESLPVRRRNDSVEDPAEETHPEDEEPEPSELEDEDEAEVEEVREQEETVEQAESSEGGAKSRKGQQQSSSQNTKSKQKTQQAATTSDPRSAIAYIPRTTVEKKWQRASAETQTQIRSLLASASVPAIASQLGPASSNSNAPSLSAVESVEGRGAEAQAAIHQAVRALERRLPKMPFPPRTEEGMFGHEELLRDHSALRAQVRAQAADIAALEAELARVRAGMDSGEKAAEKHEKEYAKEKMALEKRHKGRFGHLLKLPEKEPPDSARRIKLAAWAAGPRGGDGDLGEGGGSRRLVQEARLLVGQLQDRLAGGNDEEDDADAADEVAAEMDRAAQAIEKVIQASRRVPALQELAVG